MQEMQTILNSDELLDFCCFLSLMQLRIRNFDKSAETIYVAYLRII